MMIGIGMPIIQARTPFIVSSMLAVALNADRRGGFRRAPR